MVLKKMLLVLLFCVGILKAECPDESRNLERSFELYIEDSLCLEFLKDWALSSPQNMDALDNLMRQNFSQYPVKVFTLRKALEEELADENLAMKPDVVLTYQGLLEEGAKWEFASLLSGVVVGGGSYFFVRKKLKFLEKFNKRIWFFRVNPIGFLVGVAVAVGTGESAMYAMDVTYKKYLENSIDKGVQRLTNENDYNEEEKSNILRNIVKDSMNLVAIEERKFFIILMEGLKRIESVQGAKDFFGNLARSYPQILEADPDKNKIALLLKKLESIGVANTGEELEPLKKYLAFNNTIIKLFQWYGSS